MANPIPPGQIVLNGKTYVLDPAAGDTIQRQESAMLEAPLTIGDTTYKSHPYLHSLIISDLTGGLGVSEITGSDSTRYEIGVGVDARYAGGIGLAPLVQTVRPVADDTDAAYVIGDIPGTNEEFYIASLTAVGVVSLYAFDEGTDTFRAAATDIDYVPVNKSVVYQGSNANNRIFIPQGANGYTTARTTGVGTTTTTYSATPTVRSFCQWDNRLWSIDASNVLRYSFDGTTWYTLTDPLTGTTLTLDPARTVRHLLSWFNLAGQSTLYCVTDRDLFALNYEKGQWEHIYELPPHPTVGYGAGVWRATEDLWMSIGAALVRRTPAGVSIPLSGPGADADGMPAAYAGEIVGLAPEYNNLYAIFDVFDDNFGLLAYTGTGWHLLHLAGEQPGRTISAISKVAGGYRLWWSVASYAYSIRLPEGPQSVRQLLTGAATSFGASGWIEFGRFWAQTQGQAKIAVLVDVYMEYATATETFKLYYQTDTVTSWTQVGSTVVTGRNNNGYKTELRFGTANADGVYPGVGFNWIRFKWEFARGGTTTVSPVINAMAFHFLKQRDNTPSFQIPLIFPDIMPDGRTGDQAKHDLVDLVEATSLVTLKYGHHVQGVWVAGLSGKDNSGADQRGARMLTLVSLQEVS